MAEIVLENVTKRYPDGALAVDKVNLDIADGEFVILVGPSGCGKSTTLRMIAGLEEISDGDCDRRPGRHRPDAEGPRHRHGLPELRAVPAHDGRREHGLRTEAGQDPADVITSRRGGRAILDLDPYLDRKPKRSPAASVSASPSAGRSSATRRRSSWTSRCRTSTPSCVCRRARRSPGQRRLGITTIYVTHDQTEALTLGDRIVVLLNGVLQQIGTPRDLYENPTNVFVAGFIGSPAMNFMGADPGGGQAAHRAGGHPAGRPCSRLLSSSAAGRQMIVGIRPEDFEDASPGAQRGPAQRDHLPGHRGRGGVAGLGEVRLLQPGTGRGGRGSS